MNENYMNQMPQNPNMYAEDDIDYMKYIGLLLKNWKMIVKWGCIGVAVGLVFALSVVKSYTVTSKLAPELASKSGSSSLSSLASLAGVNLSSMNATDAMYPDLYPEVVASVPFNVELLESTVTYRGKDMTLYEYLDEHQKCTWYGYVLSAPMQALSWCIGLIAGKDDESDGGASAINAEELTYDQALVLKMLKESVMITVDKKTFLIDLSTTMQDPYVAKQVCDLVIEKLTEYITQYRTEKARDDVNYYKKINDEARDEYYAAQKKFAQYVDANQGLTRNSYLIERQRLENETQLAYQLYNATAQQLQSAEANVQMETPVCVILQPTTVPLRGTPSRAKTLMIWVFLFGAGACAWAMFGDMAKEYLAKAKEEMKDSSDGEESEE